MYDTEECPYCEHEVEINHDDGHGYEEGTIYQQECSKCGKTFVYTVEISFDHYLEKADCLNEGGVHDYQETHTYPKVCARMQCTMCGGQLPLPEGGNVLHRKKEYEERMEKIKEEKACFEKD